MKMERVKMPSIGMKTISLCLIGDRNRQKALLPGDNVSNLLLESGANLLLENNDVILFENQSLTKLNT